MSVLNKLFNRVFVLTIERNADRHSSVQEHLKGVDFEFWYGTDVPKMYPAAGSVSEMPADFFTANNIDQSFVSSWTKGQLGAYTSITKMIKEVACRYDSALIFEDDFQPMQSNWRNTLAEAIKQLPADWDILLIGYLYYGKVYKLTYNRKLRWIFNTYNTAKKFFGLKSLVKPVPKKFSSHLDCSGAALGGHAYALSKSGANKLLTYLNPMQISGDILVKKLIEEGELNAYSVYPCLFKQNKFFGSKTEITS